MLIETRLLNSSDTLAFWNLRLEGLENDPRAFGSSVDEHRAMPLEAAAARLSPVPNAAFTVGAFANETLIGTAGFFREDRAKTRHKGSIWGVYVTPEWRGKGIAKRMLSMILERLRTYSDLDHVLLHVSANQASAVQLYRSLGFETYGHEKRSLKVGDEYIDQDLMVLWL